MLGVLINHGIIPDLRIRNHRQKYEAQERRKQRMVIYDRIPELYASGMSVRAIAKELKISVPTVYEQAKVRGLDIVEKEQQAFRIKNLTAQRLVEMGYQKQKVAESMGVNRNTVFNALNRSFDSISEEDLMLVDKAVNKLIGRVEVIVETPEPQTADELETAKPQEANETTVTAESAETAETVRPPRLRTVPRPSLPRRSVLLRMTTSQTTMYLLLHSVMRTISCALNLNPTKVGTPSRMR